MTTNIRLGSVSLDCADPHVLADFWAAALDGEVAYRSDTFVAVNLGAMWLTAVTVENYEPPTWPGDETPKQIHLDLAVKDLVGGARELLDLGATRCEMQPNPESYLVFLDPAGHPFCLTTQIPD
jgi:Glyoxalase-like domain